MKKKIENWITEFIEGRARSAGTSIWEKPLVAVASARDPLFVKLKAIVSPRHLLPGDLLPGASSVITYFIPFTQDVNSSNRLARESSPEWARAYVETNKLITAINEHLTRELGRLQYRTGTVPPTHNFDPVELISQWSHKHVAYIAGLGTFGRNHLLITEKGCSGRLGSLVTDLEIPATPRPDFEYCLYKYNGTCGRCVGQCPQDVLAGESYDRQKCYQLCLENADRYQELGLADVCGKCCSLVPCSFTAPAATLVQRGKQ